LLWNLEFKI
jgi:hypothetical protein